MVSFQDRIRRVSHKEDDKFVSFLEKIYPLINTSDAIPLKLLFYATFSERFGTGLVDISIKWISRLGGYLDEIIIAIRW